MKDCEFYMESISCLIDGELGESESAALMGHLSECPACAMAYDAFKSISGAVSGSEAKAPPGFSSDVMRNIHAGGSKSKLKRSMPTARFLAAAACLAVVVFAAYQLVSARIYDNGLYGGSSGTDMAAQYSQDSGLELQPESAVPNDEPESESFTRDRAADDTLLDHSGNEAGGGPFSATGLHSNNMIPVTPEEDIVPINATASLFNMSMAEFYEAEDSPESIATFTDSDVLLLIAELLAWDESYDEAVPENEPVFVIGVTDPDGGACLVRVWIIDGLLWCGVDNDGGGLYLARGSFEDLLTLISEA